MFDDHLAMHLSRNRLAVCCRKWKMSWTFKLAQDTYQTQTLLKHILPVTNNNHTLADTHELSAKIRLSHSQIIRLSNNVQITSAHVKEVVCVISLGHFARKSYVSLNYTRPHVCVVFVCVFTCFPRSVCVKFDYICRKNQCSNFGAMLTSKVFIKKTKRGSVMKIVREHYLRDDITCGSRVCGLCEHPKKQQKPPLEENPNNRSSLCKRQHYLLPDTNVVLHQVIYRYSCDSWLSEKSVNCPEKFLYKLHCR